MPVTVTYPGVYIQEIPSGVRTITGVATSITAFIGQAARGPVNEPTTITSYGDYERTFGGLVGYSMMSYAVRQFFQNGGGQAIIVRVVGENAERSDITLGTLVLEAANEGEWGDQLQAFVDHDTKDPDDDNLFNLTVRLMADEETVIQSETFLNVSVDETSSRRIDEVLEAESSLVRVVSDLSTIAAAPAASIDGDADGEIDPATGSNGNNGAIPTDTDYQGSESGKTGIFALEKTDLFNLLCIPPIFDVDENSSVDIDPSTWSSALAYCKKRRAMLIVDAPASWNDVSDAVSGIDGFRNGWSPRDHASVYFPRVRVADPLKENRLQDFAPCGMVAGIYARTDAARGVWKAPAGQEATLSGARELSVKMTDAENGLLNPLGVNCLRTFPVYGNVVWGARTADGADRLASEWKYIPVRRLALYIEESLFRGTQWVVFEPNDEPLWAQIRLNVGAFMHNLFRQGAFQGTTPRDAYFVKCDKETTTQNDINSGIVNIHVGFAPLKPAEFVIISIQQMAGQIDT